MFGKPSIGSAALRLVTACLLTALAACSQSQATRLDSRTFRIEGPGVPGGSDVPNQREAARLCPKGYRVLDSETHHNGPNAYATESGDFTNWTVRCL